VTDQERKPRSSVPAVSQSRSGSPQLKPSPFARRKAWWGAAILLMIGYVVGIVVWGVDPDPNQYTAASSWSDWTVKIDTVSCVSVNPIYYDAKPYSGPDLTQAIIDILKIKTVLISADETTCPWGLSASAESRIDTAIRYNGYWARHLVSMAICEKEANGRLNPSRCLYRTIHVFNPRVSPYNLFRIGLVGLARPQARELEAFQLSK
jgi:hypothetical protein